MNRDDASRIQRAVSAPNPSGTSRSRSPDAQERLGLVVGAYDRRHRRESLCSDRFRRINDAADEGNERRSDLISITGSWGLRRRLRVPWLQTAEARVTARLAAPHLADGLAAAGLGLNDLAAPGLDAFLSLGSTGDNSRQSHLLNQEHQDENESQWHIPTISISAMFALDGTPMEGRLFKNRRHRRPRAQLWEGLMGRATEGIG